MECVKRCEFQKFTGTEFYCSLYENELRCFKEKGNVSVIRCDQCIKEKIEYDLIKGTNHDIKRMV